MKFNVYLRKEIAQALNDRIGLAIAFLVPFLVVWIYSLLDLDLGTLGGTFRETNPLALILCLAVWLASLTMASGAIHRERLAGTLQRLSVTPFVSGMLVAAKATVYLVIGLVQSVIVWLAGQLFLASQFEDTGPLRLIPLFVALAFVATALGLFLSSFLGSSTQISNAATFVTLLAVTLSGFLKPLNGLGALGSFAAQFPFTLGYRAVRLSLDGEHLAAEASVMVIEAVALLIVSAFITTRLARRPLTK